MYKQEKLQREKQTQQQRKQRNTKMEGSDFFQLNNSDANWSLSMGPPTDPADNLGWARHLGHISHHIKCRPS